MRFIAALIGLVLLSPSGAFAGGTVTACSSDIQNGAGLNLKDALAGGGLVKFQCRGNAVIRITRTHHLTRPGEVDGANRITLRADPLVPMFTAEASADRVTFRNLKLHGARAVPFGGVFDGQASSLDLLNVEVQSVGTSPGAWFGLVGGSVIRANRIQAEDSRFTDNAGALLLAPTLTIRRSEFRNNAGQPFMPNFEGEGGRAVIEDTTFSGNGLSVWRGELEIRNSHFISNGLGSPAYGGALGIGRKAAIEKSTFINNRAPNGAGIWLADGELSLRRVTFEGNIASGIGGALGISASAQPASVSIRHSHFRRNQARSGGAIAFQRQPAAARVLRGYAVNFASNSAQQNGGAIEARSAAIELTRVQSVGNRAGGIGGFIFSGADFNNQTRLANALLVRNNAVSGSVYSGLKLELINATVADNQGPAIALVADHAATATLRNTIVSNNVGGGCGSLPGSEAGTFVDGGHNVQFPAADCGAVIRVIDPALDGMYVPVPDSPVRYAGDTPTCMAPPISGRDMHNEPRPQARDQCTIGAIESTIERHAIRALRESDAPGRLADFLKFLNLTRDNDSARN